MPSVIDGSAMGSAMGSGGGGPSLNGSFMGPVGRGGEVTGALRGPTVAGRVLSVSVQLLAVLVVLGAAGAVFAVLEAGKEKPRVAERVAYLPRVDAIGVERRVVAQQWVGYGTARALDGVDVASEVDGLIVERPAGVEAGAEVGEGELLIAVDERDYAALAEARRRAVEGIEAELRGLEFERVRAEEQLAQAREELAANERDLQRARDTVSRGAGTQSEVDLRTGEVARMQRQVSSIGQVLDTWPSRRDGALARLAAARAELVTAELSLSRTRVVSPIGGRLQDVFVERGERVRLGEVVARVVDLSRVEVPLRLPLDAAGSVGRGSRVRLTRDADTGTEWVGVVERVAPEASESTRTVTVFVVVEQEAGGEAEVLRPGQFVKGVAESGGGEAVWVAPRRAVRDGRVWLALPTAERGPSGARAWRTVAMGVGVRFVFEARLPELGSLDQEWCAVEALGEVPAGAVVVVTDLQALDNPERVAVILRGAGGVEVGVDGVGEVGGVDGADGVGGAE